MIGLLIGEAVPVIVITAGLIYAKWFDPKTK